MKPFDILAALIVVALWGFNFVVIKLGLQEIPPLLLCVMRFTLAAFPAVFFIARPAVPFRQIAIYGLIMFALQFALLFGGMRLGLSAGIASLALQSHVFVTIALAVLFLHERPSPYQLIGALLGAVGILVVALHIGGDISALGLMCVLLAALSWGVGNLVSKRIGKVDMLALVVWGSLVAPVPLLALSLLIEGPARIADSLGHLSWRSLAAVAYLAYPTTLLGFSIWNRLLSRYPVASVAPFTLLVPVFGMLSSAWVLDEALQPWKILAAMLVIAGLCLNVFGPRLSWRLLAVSRR